MCTYGLHTNVHVKYMMRARVCACVFFFTHAHDHLVRIKQLPTHTLSGGGSGLGVLTRKARHDSNAIEIVYFILIRRSLFTHEGEKKHVFSEIKKNLRISFIHSRTRVPHINVYVLMNIHQILVFFFLFCLTFEARSTHTHGIVCALYATITRRICRPFTRAPSREYYRDGEMDFTHITPTTGWNDT